MVQYRSRGDGVGVGVGVGVGAGTGTGASGDEGREGALEEGLKETLLQ